MIKISVILPTYNPNKHRLQQALLGLKNQTLPVSDWELLIIDNNSSLTFSDFIEIDWHINTRIIKESKPGLTFARIKGFIESVSPLIVMVDDDNILAKNYLEQVIIAFNENPKIGALGGKSLPLFESSPPKWLFQFYGILALRNLGNEVIIDKWNFHYPTSSPIGAGMGIRKKALGSYTSKIQAGNNKITDRRGEGLSSGGDNDIILEILKSGWEVAYFPSLALEHIIPEERMKVKYLGRLNKKLMKSWVQVLDVHMINPWNKIPRWSYNLRKLKAWFIYQPWKNEKNYINYQGICGMYKGLSDL